MPVNDWDYLMGDKMSMGHKASSYTLENWTDLINEYHQLLAPYLSIRNPRDSIDSHVHTASDIKVPYSKLSKIRIF